MEETTWVVRESPEPLSAQPGKTGWDRRLETGDHIDAPADSDNPSRCPSGAQSRRDDLSGRRGDRHEGHLGFCSSQPFD